MGLLKANEAPPYPIKYFVYYAHTLLRVAIGLSYASIAPIATLFVFAYLLLQLVLVKKNLVYLYTNPAETRGEFFPAAIGMLSVCLFFCQLLLAAVHAAKASWVTFGLLLPLMLITYLANGTIQSQFRPQLATLPLAGLGSSPAAPPAADLDEETLGTAYIQPELVHPQVADKMRVQEILERCAFKTIDTTFNIAVEQV